MRAKTDAIFIVVKGSLKVYLPQAYGHEALLNIVGPREVLGEINFMDGQGHSAEVAALEACQLLRIERGILLEIYEVEPKLREPLDCLVGQRVRRLSQRQAWMAASCADERVGRALLHFGERYVGPDDSPDSEIAIPLRLSQSDLAALVGASRYRVHLCLHTLKLQRFLRMETNSRMTLLDPSRLQEWCDQRCDLQDKKNSRF